MLIGHHQQWQFLKKSAESGELAHAYLFCGQEKLGKKTLALELAKLLKCEKNQKNGPCQQCFSCRQVEKKIHPDLIFIEPDPEKKEIVIGQIRNLCWKLSLTPNSGLFKIAIIDRAHLMNEEAQTCLLKTLEEPPGQSILILITEYPESIQPTILSRLQRIKFYPVGKKEMASCLEKNKISQKETAEIIDFSFGCPGRALDFAVNPRKLKEREKIIADLNKVLASDITGRFQYARSLSQSPGGAKEILDTWLNYLRNMLIFSLNKPTFKYPAAKMANMINLVQNTNFLLSSTNINVRLALEVMMLDF